MARLTVREHIGYKGAQAICHPHHIHAEAPAPVVGREGPHAALGLLDTHARVVAQNVHVAEGLPAGHFQGGHGIGRGDIRLHADNAQTRVPELGGGLLQCRGLDVGHHHVHPLARKQFTQAAPHTRGAAGDHRGLSLEVIFHVVSLL